MDSSGTYPTISNTNYPLKNVDHPHSHDVLCGRGGGTNNHVGNSHWRMLVAANKQLYVSLPKRQKMLLSRSIVNAVRSQNPPGRFLQKEANSDKWSDVGDQRAQEKTSQALREGAPDIRSKLNDDGQADTSIDGSTSSSTSPDLAALKSTPDTPSAPLSPAKYPLQETPIATTVIASQPHKMPSTTVYSITTTDGSLMQMPLPGSTPVMVTYQTPNGMQSMPMYPAVMIQGPNGMMVPTMPLHMNMMQQQHNIQSYNYGVTQEMQSNINANYRINMNIPPPTDLSISPTPSTTLMPPPPRSEPHHNQSSPNKSLNHRNNSAKGRINQQVLNEQPPSMIDGGLEPAGLSFGTIGSASMMSFANEKLEAAGTSFGSVMSFSVASRPPETERSPDMVDGGLEPIGTSFGSLSLNSVDQKKLQQALEANNPNRIDPRWTKPNRVFAPEKSNDITFATQTLFAEQRSSGNLLECSDTESEDEVEALGSLQANKTAEWEKLQAMISHQTNSHYNSQYNTFPLPLQGTIMPSERLPTTTFEHNFSELSAMSMGEDFLESPDTHNIRKQIQIPDYPFINSNSNTPHDVTPFYGIIPSQICSPDAVSYRRPNNDLFDHDEAAIVPPPVDLAKANEENAVDLEIMFLSRGTSLVFDDFKGQQEQV